MVARASHEIETRAGHCSTQWKNSRSLQKPEAFVKVHSKSLSCVSPTAPPAPRLVQSSQVSTHGVPFYAIE